MDSHNLVFIVSVSNSVPFTFLTFPTHFESKFKSVLIFRSASDDRKFYITINSAEQIGTIGDLKSFIECAFQISTPIGLGDSLNGKLYENSRSVQSQKLLMYSPILVLPIQNEQVEDDPNQLVNSISTQGPTSGSGPEPESTLPPPCRYNLRSRNPKQLKLKTAGTGRSLNPKQRKLKTAGNGRSYNSHPNPDSEANTPPPSTSELLEPEPREMPQELGTEVNEEGQPPRIRYQIAINAQLMKVKLESDYISLSKVKSEAGVKAERVDGEGERCLNPIRSSAVIAIAGQGQEPNTENIPSSKNPVTDTDAGVTTDTGTSPCWGCETAGIAKLGQIKSRKLCTGSSATTKNKTAASCATVSHKKLQIRTSMACTAKQKRNLVEVEPTNKYIKCEMQDVKLAPNKIIKCPDGRSASAKQCKSENSTSIDCDNDKKLLSFKCNFTNCNYATLYSSTIRRHERTHFGRKEYVCTHGKCSYQSNRKENLAGHVKRRHEINTEIPVNI